jgi:hypothetical protein
MRSRRWVRRHGHGAVSEAVLGVFAAVRDEVYDLHGAQGCPLSDMALGSKPFQKPRLPVLLSPVVEGSALLGDEYSLSNSFCRSDLHEDFERGEDMANCHSQCRIPVAQRVFISGSATVTIEDHYPRGPHGYHTPSAEVQAARRRAAIKTDSHRQRRQCNYYLRQRQLRTEAIAEDA